MSTFPYSFNSGSTIFATNINSNYSTWIDILTDGTATMNVGGLSVTTCNIAGDTTIGSGVSQYAAFNAQFNTHLVGSGTAIGTSSYPIGDLYLDNGTSHAGTVYFDGGSTDYVKFTSGATSVQYGGFSYLDYNSGTVTNVATINGSNVTLGSDMTVSGLIYGGTSIYEFHGQNGISSTGLYAVGIDSNTSITNSVIAIRSGSIANIYYNISNYSVSGSGNVSFRLYQNGSSVYTIASFVATSTSQVNTGVVSFARNSYVVNASDAIGVIIDSYTTGSQTYRSFISVELFEDS